MKKVFSKEDIARTVTRLGREIATDYRGKNLVLVVILKGSYLFAADLSRAIDIPLQIEFMRASSYGASTCSSQQVEIKLDLEGDLNNKDLLLVEDILDTGRTLSALYHHLLQRQPASLRICTLIDKRERREINIESDYVGFNLEEGFIVGYGLDYNESLRNLAEIYHFEEDASQETLSP
ncbi:MAG: hypoxanthine phosphoribosyltransferase [Desulfuromonadaceae bacterium]|nr:hypoxanthine phosphoribosyltransferase [Desulfuromonadaceae bacterium]